MKLATALLQLDFFYPSLDEVCIVFDIDRSPYGETHRVLADTLVLCNVLDAIKQESEQKGYHRAYKEISKDV